MKVYQAADSLANYYWGKLPLKPQVPGEVDIGGSLTDTKVIGKYIVNGTKCPLFFYIISRQNN